MGNDGGSVPKGSELRKTKKVEKQTDGVEASRARWLSCALSRVPLLAPIVTDRVGHLLNKDALIQALLHKRLPPHLDHIRSLKDVFEVKFHANSAYGGTVAAAAAQGGTDFVSPFDCPITGRQVNGQYAFIAIKKCGHVFSEKGLRETEKLGPDGNFHCYTCTTAYGKDDLHVLNPAPELVEELRERIKAEQKAAKASRKRAHDALKDAKNGDGAEKSKERSKEKSETSSEPKLKKHKPDLSTSSSSSSLNAPSLAVKVAMMKADSAIDQRKASEAYNSIFAQKSSTAPGEMNFTGIYLK